MQVLARYLTKDPTFPRQIVIKTEPQDQGMRLDKVLSLKIPDISRTRLKELIQKGQVNVNGKPCLLPRHKLKGREVVQVLVPEPTPLEMAPIPMDLEIIFEDLHIVVVNKPAGLVVHPGAGNLENTLVHGLLHHCENLSGIGGIIRPGIVHRLDKDTSGVMIIAKSDAAHQALVTAFKARQVKKTYVAITSGYMRDKEGVINLPIGRHPVRRTKMAVNCASGRHAVTQFRVEKNLYSAQLLKIRLHTGRTHQIRVHMSHMGHPLLGDSLYGGPSKVKTPSGERIEIKRQMLHAQGLEMMHPATKGRRLELHAPIPEDMRRVIRVLEKD